MKRLLFLLAFLAGGCASLPEPPAQGEPPSQPPGRGGYYKDDGPGEKPPADLAAIPDAEPKLEPLRRAANRPYQALGKEYVPLAALQPFRQRGLASWYGKRYHGQKTSSGETYDMYAMTAAHPTLPIPSYARVTNVANGRSVVVRINDRGPFIADRIVDLSYTAAWKLGYVQAGSAEVELESIVPGEAPVLAARSQDAPQGQNEAQGVYLQLGAFASRENAEDLRGRVVRQLAWLADAVQVLAQGSLWRLHVGPYRSSDAARSVAERIEAELNLKPLLVVR